MALPSALEELPFSPPFSRVFVARLLAKYCPLVVVTEPFTFTLPAVSAGVQAVSVE
jgi:hypothetical protein